MFSCTATLFTCIYITFMYAKSLKIMADTATYHTDR